ncbi:MarR family winged helix-turn-helix transcriptional regulator [Agromyces sp. MMS24-JH15]|uniref:MarR family winged helix-turn-helix transcriptional regulator n=1 Tax=Agromyces sp. MMS24-JH15 TaxID=3243765 RepID=UPI0037491F50
MEPSVLDRLLRIGDLFDKDLARVVRGTTLTPSRLRVLRVIQHVGPMTQHALAAALEVSPRNVTGLVDALEAGGYVRRTPHPRDRRAVLVVLTDPAVELMAGMRCDQAELGRALLEAVDPADRAAFERGVAAVADRLAVLVAGAGDGVDDEPRAERFARARSTPPGTL